MPTAATPDRPRKAAPPRPGQAGWAGRLTAWIPDLGSLPRLAARGCIAAVVVVIITVLAHWTRPALDRAELGRTVAALGREAAPARPRSADQKALGALAANAVKIPPAPPPSNRPKPN